MDLSIVIVNYKTPQLLKECVQSIFNFKEDLSVEVIIVDNNSEDNSKEVVTSEFPKVVWLQSGYNAGFSRANNIGIRKASGEYVLVLNPDSYIKKDFLKKFLNFYKSKDQNDTLGLLGCRIISSIDASLLVGSGLGFPSIKRYLKANPLFIFLTRRFLKKEQKYLPNVMHYKNHEIDFVSGACVLIKRSKIEKHELYFDEDFFLYSEDVEWSYRVKQKGFHNYFYSEIEVYHVNSASTNNSPFKGAQMKISEYLFLYKILGKGQYTILGWLLRFNLFLNSWLVKKGRQLDPLNSIKKEQNIFKVYYHKITKEFNKSPSSAKEYLKYVE